MVDLKEMYLVVEICFLTFIKEKKIDITLIEDILEKYGITKKGFKIYALSYIKDSKEKDIIKKLNNVIFEEIKMAIHKGEDLKALARKYEVSSKELESFFETYLEKTYGYSEKTIAKYKKGHGVYLKFINNQGLVYISPLEEYFKYYASLEEKEIIKEKIKEIVKHIQILEENGLYAEGYFKELHFSLERFYDLTKTCFGTKDDILKIFDLIGKKYYEFLESINFNKEKAKQVALKYKLPLTLIYGRANLYMNNVLGTTVSQKKNSMVGKASLIIDDKTKNLEEILKTNRKLMVIKLFNKYHYYALDITRYAYVVNNNLAKEIQIKIENNLKIKYKIYSHFKRRAKFLEELLKVNSKEAIIILLEKFTLSLEDIVIFAQAFNQDKSLEEQVKIEENLKAKYKFYLDYKRSKLTERIRKIEQEEEKVNTNNTLVDFKMVATYILDGINGREFDYIDFLQYFPHLKYYKKYHSALLSTCENAVLKIFLNKYKLRSYQAEENFINCYIEVNAEISQDGMPIKGTGRFLTKEEKIEIIDYLKTYNIPLYDVVLDAAVKRYINGTLIKNNTLQR